MSDIYRRVASLKSRVERPESVCKGKEILKGKRDSVI